MRPLKCFGLLQKASRMLSGRVSILRQNNCVVDSNRLSHDGRTSLLFTSGRPISHVGHIRTFSTLEIGGVHKLCILFQEIGNRLDLAERALLSTPNKKVNDDTRTENNSQKLSDSLRRTSTANITSDFCNTYLSLPDMSVSTWCNEESVQVSEKRLFFDLLFEKNSGIDEKAIISTMTHVLSHRQDAQISDQFAISNNSIRRLRELCTPRYERIFNHILGSAHQDLGVAFLVKLRQDLRELIHWLRFSQMGKEEYEMGKEQILHQNLSTLRVIERNIQSILTSLFRPGVLTLQQITYDRTPASIIEQIAFKEAVHPLQSLKDLRTRLGPGRRCFAFFHPALRNSPLVFVHVALLPSIPESMRDIEAGTQRIVDGTDLESEATCAAFYSITNAEPGLSGVDLGNHLIKSVVRVMKNEFPTLATYCTLSPIPNFRRWLEDKMIRHRDATDRRERVISSGDENNIASDKFFYADLLNQEDLRSLESLLSSTDATTLVSLQNPSNEFRPLLMKLAAYYLTVETHHGRPLCPVAKFHIRNGAEMYRLNYLGDTTCKGLRNSCGIMINYRYLLEELEENHVNYERTGKIAVRDGVKNWIVERRSS